MPLDMSIFETVSKKITDKYLELKRTLPTDIQHRALCNT